MTKGNINKRVIALFALFGVFLAGFFAILFNVQMVDRETYSASSAVSQYSVSVEAPRGDILDRNGNAMVYNEQIRTLTFNYLTFPSDDEAINRLINSLILHLDKKNEKWIDELPLVFDENGKIAYKEDSDAAIAWLKGKNMCAVNYYATAEDCLNVLIEKYALEIYGTVAARNIASVRYNMDKMYFSASAPYTFAENISVTTIAYVKENSIAFPGVDASSTAERKYAGDGTAASHILGVTGAISAEEYALQKENTAAALSQEGLSETEISEIKNKSYALNDKIGKNGIESAMESYLRGTKGTKTLSVNAAKQVLESYSVLPEAGNTVFLTIDSSLQEIADKSLKNQIMAVTKEEALASGLTPAGAVVVQDVNTGAVLATSSYPNFSLSTYFEDYQALSENEGKPLWNRAVQSTYSPGSTMKPVIAIAALEEGIITASSKIYCEGQYEYIDQVFACFNKTAHGGINVEKALQHSCNIFFFELARQLGIEKMNTYSSLFGLGQKTGIEIAESAGILAGIQYRDSLGLGWKAGETLLAAIGQSDNSFTPLQLNNYCATIANGGTRYVPYLIEKIVSADYRSGIFEHTPEIAVETNISKSTLDTVKKGMYLVANEGSCAPYLGKLKYKVACKTGTAEKTLIVNDKVVEGTDGFLIAFGPYEDPEIAITVVIENAGSGSSTAQVAADIFRYYYSTIDTAQFVQQENTVIW
ncbi:MAG: hypothetical protein IJO68_00610 [Clostridia bacterium]|nr:hypothetical protein [Clostridia bacterium]